MRRYATLSIILVFGGTLLWGTALASSGHRGLGYEQAMQYRKAQAAARNAEARPVGPSAAERNAMRVWGRASGRWWDLAISVGWRPDEMPTLMRVLKAESHGARTARNPYSKCSGLMQLHPCWWNGKWHFNPFNARLNLKYALWIKRHCGWDSWTTY